MSETYESADYYQASDLADWLHPRLEGRPWCAFSPKALCPYTRRSAELAEALLCEDGWVEGFMYHRLTAAAQSPTPPITDQRGASDE